MPKALVKELFRREDVRKPRSRDSRYYSEGNLIYPNAFMPAVDTSGLSSDIREPVRQGIEEVRKESPVGIIEERYDGSVPVHIDNNPPYAGITEFGDHYAGPRANRVGISNRLSKKAAKRVAKHEGRHVRSERLLKYADVPQRLTTLVMESYAEFGGYLAALRAGKNEEAKEIRRTTPYPGAVEFGEAVQRHYISNYDGKKGYDAFIRDIQKNGSMARTFSRLEDNIRGARNHRMEDLRVAA